jgi:hypothetical protein
LTAENVRTTVSATASTTSGISSDEAVRAGFVLAPEDPQGYVPADAAVRVAAQIYDFGEGTRIEPFLYRLTAAGHTGDVDDPVIDRPVWIVRFSGPSVRSFQEIPAPPPGQEPIGPPGELTLLYVVIDARSGADLFARWT